MGRTLSRVAGVVFAGALATFAAAPAALAQTETSTSATETPTSTSESPTSSSPTSTTTPPATSVTPATTPSSSTKSDVKTTERRIVPRTEAAPDKPVEEAPKDDYQDNVGHGFVGLGGEGVLVIACAAGRPGEVATQYLSVTGGPDQDEADGRLWNYSVRVVDAPAGTTTAKFSWTCGGVEGNGTVEFEQKQQPPTSTVTVTATATSTATSTTTATSTATPSSGAPASSTTPGSTTTSATPAGNAAPKAQVKVAPKGGVETGFGGTAR
ncbi:hypothetical protein [Amycolatopsis plumensis]|uniref:Secreted protein n=1 Tax=Amycolatopsis plumensis TaxID=236508 RepID=A0ABV5UGH1_9PSEU